MAPTYVFVHGSNSNSFGWAPLKAELALRGHRTLAVDLPGHGTERVDAATWGRIPRSYVRLTRDTSIPVALQDRFIREADALTPANPFDVYSLDSSHIGFLLHPEAAATVLAGMAGAGSR